MTNTRDPNRAWKEASLSAAKSDARGFFNRAMLHAHNGKEATAQLRFNSAIYYLELVHKHSQELAQWQPSSK